jgi:hypothetical protein
MNESPFGWSKGMKWLDRALFIVVTAVILAVMCLCSYSLVIQIRDYESGARAAVQGQGVDHAAVLAYTRALSAAVVKTSAVFLGFLLVFTGALYVLRKETAKYGLKFTVKDHESPIAADLAANSPGLVMITLGVVLLTAALFSQSRLDYESTPLPVPAGGKERPLNGRQSSQYERPPQ